MKTVSYIIAALALLACPACGESDEVKPNVPPQVKITAPVDGAEVEAGKALEIEWTATDEDGTIETLALRLNGKAVGAIDKEAVSHLVAAADLKPGSLKIELEATDDDGETGRATITVTVAAEPKDPVCELSQPAEGAEYRLSDELIVRGDARDEDGTIEKVVLKIGDKVVGSVSEVPFEHTVSAEEKAVGDLVLTLEVEDNDGRKASDRRTVKILPDPKAPACSITAPAEGAEFPQGVPVEVEFTASDEDGEVTRATLSYGDRSIEIADIASGKAVIETADLTTGAVTLTLMVEDNDGLTSEASVGIVVTEPGVAPTCSLLLPLAGVAYTAGDIVIRGTGEDSDGTIAKVELKAGGRVVADVTSVPFVHVLPQAELPTGNVSIELTVTDDSGLKATAKTDISVVSRFGTMTDARDGKEYRTVQLGERIWLAENLAYLPEVHKWNEGSNVSGNAGKKFYYVFGYVGNDVEAARQAESYKKGGVLYNWYAAMDGAEAGDPTAKPSGVRGACPEGWHLPSKAEMDEMIAWVAEQIPDSYAVNGQKNISGVLRGCDDWMTKTNADYPQLEFGGLDVFGFGAYPNGQRMATGGFDNQKTYMFLWDTEFAKPVKNGGYTTLRYDRYEVNRSYINANRGQSVRCVKDY